MIDGITVFTKGGVVLWSYQYIKIVGDPIDDLIKSVLLEERTGMAQHKVGAYTLKWRLATELDLVFVVIYQGILALTYLESILDSVKAEFVSQLGGKVTTNRLEFTDSFLAIMKKADKHLTRRSTKPSVSDTKRPQGNGNSRSTDATEQDGDEDEAAEEEGDPNTDSIAEARKKLLAKAKGKPKKAAAAPAPAEPEKGKKKKEARAWAGQGKVDSKSMAALDRSKKVDPEDADAAMRATYLGDDGSDVEGAEVESIASESEEEEAAPAEDGRLTSLFKRMSSSVQSITGNKVMTEEDLAPILKTVKDELMAKNVAVEVAARLLESVQTTLLGKRTAQFSSVRRSVKEALTEAMTTILAPKRSVDVLRAALEAKAAGRVYSVAFLGVNGVGKSTNLAKVAYYLQHQGGLNVMIAACDTFRSGAVEQLKTHARCLGAHLFERGYGKDAADIAKQALQYAEQNGYDVVLIDTAGRMQDNEPLMRAIAKLVAINTPDLVLFVGEALTGNDSIDQLTKFNRSLIDMSHNRAAPRGVDGILLTKYDTVDDKVGAAVSMVYLSGQPVVFVGTGQKYTHLRKLQVKEVVKALLG
mmetsp:Transcript_18290/g.40488  ORF Transcript_18290/g.40488 Transcript_18290/m.40488 type:complete len:586 (-) Transcript_18290:96-1853(-)